MFAPAPISEKFVPYNKRPVYRHNAGLFIDGGGGGRGLSQVALQSRSCSGQRDCTVCATSPSGQHLYCINGECVGTEADCP